MSALFNLICGKPAKAIPASITEAIPKTHHTIPPGFGSPVADGMECAADSLINCAETVRKYEPLSIEILRRRMKRIVRAQGEYMDAIGGLLDDLGR